MIRAVFGIGPRVGSSWLMHQLKEAGLPIHYDRALEAKLPKEGNPQGYYETRPSDLPFIENKICKVWPKKYGPIEDIEKMVVLHRPYSHQIKSIKKQIEREKHLLVGKINPRKLITDAKVSFQKHYLSIPHLKVSTLELTDRLPEIIEYMRY